MGKLIVSSCKYCNMPVALGPKGRWLDSSSDRPDLCADLEHMHEPHIWYAEKGGQVVMDLEDGNGIYTFIKVPGGNSNFEVGDRMPKGWHIN